MGVVQSMLRNLCVACQQTIQKKTTPVPPVLIEFAVTGKFFHLEIILGPSGLRLGPHGLYLGLYGLSFGLYELCFGNSRP